ncbi:MAG: MEMO1 family protein [Nanoarchaeota archaeon]|nr:MEMO1 family protein [Nanoarchaeota archaeon]MBU4299867.1 MEMO1 family protein [Nanoarchaeota archaeon]MBU4451647.1 MEMO1 family protein [Nanoarchaeota archaeon]MCG2723634.1 MEMO1 family protein [archaeon]
MLRQPAVSGMFYSADESRLKEQLARAFANAAQTRAESRKVIGIIAPHAGYEYSGFTAARAYSAIGKSHSKTFIILGPNHTGTGSEISVSVWNRGAWLTPLGECKIDEIVAGKIISKSAIAKADARAHIQEHSIEVQIPFLQFLFGNEIKVVPICMADQSISAAQDIAKAVLSLDEEVTIIASSDFTHYEGKKEVERKDAEAIKAIESLDVPRFYNALEENDISACGFGPIAVLMLVAKAKGAKIKRIAQTTSGDITGETKSVVGYAAMKAIL